MLTTLTPARTTALTTYATAKDALRLNYEDQTVLDQFIRSASAAIVRYCQRPFARAVYQETVAGYGRTRLRLTGTPVVRIASLLHRGQTVEGWALDNPEAGLITREQGWPWSAQVSLGTLEATVVPASEQAVYQVIYTGGYLVPGDNRTSATFSLDATDNSLNESAGTLPLLVPGDQVELAGFGLLGNNGLASVVSGTSSKVTLAGLTLTTENAGAHLYRQGTTFSIQASDLSLNDSAGGLGSLLPGDTLQLVGFATPGNNGTDTIVSVTPTKVILDGNLPLVDEPAGATVSVTLLHPQPASLLLRTLPEDVEMACIEVVRAWYLQRAFDLTGPRIVQTDGGTAVLSAPSGIMPKAAQELLKPWKRVV
jgi:hypothetical protein